MDDMAGMLVLFIFVMSVAVLGNGWLMHRALRRRVKRKEELLKEYAPVSANQQRCITLAGDADLIQNRFYFGENKTRSYMVSEGLITERRWNDAHKLLTEIDALDERISHYKAQQILEDKLRDLYSIADKVDVLPY